MERHAAFVIGESLDDRPRVPPARTQAPRRAYVASNRATVLRFRTQGKKAKDSDKKTMHAAAEKRTHADAKRRRAVDSSQSKEGYEDGGELASGYLEVNGTEGNHTQAQLQFLARKRTHDERQLMPGHTEDHLRRQQIFRTAFASPSSEGAMHTVHHINGSRAQCVCQSPVKDDQRTYRLRYGFLDAVFAGRDGGSLVDKDFRKSSALERDEEKMEARSRYLRKSRLHNNTAKMVPVEADSMRHQFICTPLGQDVFDCGMCCQRTCSPAHAANPAAQKRIQSRLELTVSQLAALASQNGDDDDANLEEDEEDRRLVQRQRDMVAQTFGAPPPPTAPPRKRTRKRGKANADEQPEEDEEDHGRRHNSDVEETTWGAGGAFSLLPIQPFDRFLTRFGTAGKLDSLDEYLPQDKCDMCRSAVFSGASTLRTAMASCASDLTWRCPPAICSSPFLAKLTLHRPSLRHVKRCLKRNLLGKADSTALDSALAGWFCKAGGLCSEDPYRHVCMPY
ncbi:hypothetical protein CYMTET_8366 [Cymbomonas tetramitiformis]|uniref:Uncharacterized protein n=1 Tax=Cymbomonas tetramitiformis TaxID=36881 RepID=A0AAE0GV18_9CHLO|nr:hypothetical protein CYMTET_8366 [Cymbomonas tetramitiformis]